jgi:nicotinic acid mononucleotide adenylyltransferase
VPEIDAAEAQALGFSPDRTIVGHVDSPPISATEVRARIAQGEPFDDLVPPPVAEVIRQRGLYR